MAQVTQAERLIVESLKQRLLDVNHSIQALELQQMELPKLKRARNFLVERIELLSQCQMPLFSEDQEIPVDYHEEKTLLAHSF